MRVPEGAVGFCGFIFGVVGFGVLCVGFGVGAVASKGNIIKMSFKIFVFLWRYK